MTTIFEQEVKCAVCGSTRSFIVIGSTNAFGHQDLDGRPPEMARSTMFAWVQRCPVCGYCAHTIDEETEITEDWLESEAYQTCEGNDIRSGLARAFYNAAMVLLHDGHIEKAANTLICAAWACDDEDDRETAKTCRLKAEELLRSLPDDEQEREFRMTLRMDLLRRAGLFEKVQSEFGNYRFEDRSARKFARVELKLAENKDDTCHTTCLVFNNSPAWDEVVPVKRKQTESE